MANQIGRKYDIIINGGGIVGFTLLNSILKSPNLNRFKVLLIEQATKPSSFKQQSRIVDKPTDLNKESESEKKFSNRVSSITQTSRTAFDKLGVWECVKGFAKDVTDIKVWNYNYSNKIVFQQNAESCNENVGDTVFSVLENNRLSSALLENIHKDPNGRNLIVWNTSLQSISGNKDLKSINICAKNNESGEQIEATAPLILGCDGFKSKVRELAHFKYHEYNLNKTAIVGTVRMDSMSRGPLEINNIAYQRFSNSKDSVAAILPLDNEYSSFVISAPNDYAKYLLDIDNETFIDEFNTLLSDDETPENPMLNALHNLSNNACELVRNSLGASFAARRVNLGSTYASAGLDSCPRLDSVVDNSRATFPLFFGTTTPKMTASLPGRDVSQIGLLGDASHRVHPLAGQGLNLGIQDALELVKQLEIFARSGEATSNIAAISKALKRFEIRRQAYIVPMSAGILSMQQLFKFLPASAVTGIDRCPWIKSNSVSFANGC